ncbi:hypothetical protein Tco_0364547 [Tanacetum coccineum]
MDSFVYILLFPLDGFDTSESATLCDIRKVETIARIVKNSAVLSFIKSFTTSVQLGGSEVDINKKTENQVPKYKTEHGMEKTVQKQPKSKNAKSESNTEESASNRSRKLNNTIECNSTPTEGPGKPIVMI